MAGKKIDDYIIVKKKEHEDEQFVKDLSFSAVKKISDPDMPVYSTPADNDDQGESPSNEEE